MDPLSILGAIAAISQVTGTVGKCSKLIYDASINAGGLSYDVCFFASHLDNFEVILAQANSTIREHIIRNPKSAAIKRVRDGRVLQRLAKHIKYLLRPYLEGFRRGSKGQSMNFMARVKWLMRKEARNEMCLWMQRIQTHFQVIMETITIEMLSERQDNPLPGDHILFNSKIEL